MKKFFQQYAMRGFFDNGSSGSGGSGLTTAQINALHGMFKVCLFDDSKDVDSAIAAFEAAFGLSGGGEEPDIPDIPDVKTYSVSAELINVTSSNKATAVNENASYTTTLSAADGYKLDAVSVLMDGVDVTADVYADGVISISAVTGNVEIVASAVVEEETQPEMNTNGLVNFFDLRNAASTAVTGGGGGVKATVGNGMLWNWVNPFITASDNRGATFARYGWYSEDGSAEQSKLGTSRTVIATGYALDHNNTPVPGGITYTNLLGLVLKPTYIKADGTSVNPQVIDIPDVTEAGYHVMGVTVDGETLKVYEDGVLVLTLSGSDYSDFDHWFDTASMSGSVDHVGMTMTAFAAYNRALTDTEMVEMSEYLKTLEVSA